MRHPKEAVGPLFSLPAMQAAQARTWEAVQHIAQSIAPGMDEATATTQAHATLQNMGMDRLWHPTLIRFGESTLKTFKSPATPPRVLQSDGIFFVDIGVVWGGHEGDAGATFAVGHDADHHACAGAAKQIFDATQQAWLQGNLTGQEIYAFAAERATAMGWVLHKDIRGHRVSDFPHAPYKAGNLGDYDGHLGSGLWVLEIQIRHPHRPFGAFYEDLLVHPDGLGRF